MERLKFEESFRDAFNGAEIEPSEAVWANVELDLEKSSGGKMKRRLLFFQLLAAASMVFAMGVGGVYYLNGPQVGHDQTIATAPETTPTQKESNKLSATSSDQNSQVVTSSDDQTTENLISNSGKSQKSGALSAISPNKTAIVQPADESRLNQVASTDSAIENKRDFTAKERALPRLANISEPQLVVNKKKEPEPDAGMLLLARLKDEERKYQSAEKKNNTERLWTSVGVGMGSFNPNLSSSTSGTMTSLSGGSSSSSDPSSGSSYSVGISVATKVSNRFVVQGGISYLSQNAEFTSSTVSSDHKASLNELAAGDVRAAATSPYKVNSNLQFMSIPVQAGYIIVNRQVALQINGGVATDIFFQSTLTPEHSDLEEVKQGSGSDSPYRTVNFSGLLGTEVSYKIGDHYRIALNPGLRYALNSIYKSEVATDISPVTYDVSLRFRYIFK